eukprot:scaffold14028_cov83-Isochrysis_galbana.AAC.1
MCCTTLRPTRAALRPTPCPSPVEATAASSPPPRTTPPPSPPWACSPSAAWPSPTLRPRSSLAVATSTRGLSPIATNRAIAAPLTPASIRSCAQSTTAAASPTLTGGSARASWAARRLHVAGVFVTTSVCELGAADCIRQIVAARRDEKEDCADSTGPMHTSVCSTPGRVTCRPRPRTSTSLRPPGGGVVASCSVALSCVGVNDAVRSAWMA